MIAGRDFTADDSSDGEKVVIVSQSLATQLFPGRDVLNRTLYWTDPVMRFISVSQEPRRIVGIVPDIDDEHIVPGATMSVYHPFEQQVAGGRVFVHVRSDPYAMVPPITRIVRELAADQPVERAATLADVRAEVLAPDRLNTAVFGLFAVVAVAIAVVGVAGVLAFSVGSRTREFGIKMALGSLPQNILLGVVWNGAAMAIAGVGLGVVAGFVGAKVAASYLERVQMPGMLVAAAAGLLLLMAAVAASVAPAARAARTNVIEALRAE
jgi:ABC-type antimicrobial peptide transport system permease subunit